MRLVDDWRNGKKWLSVHLGGGTAAMNLAGAFVSGGVKVAVPLIGLLPLRWVFVAGAVGAIAAVVGRFICQTPKPGAQA